MGWASGLMGTALVEGPGSGAAAGRSQHWVLGFQIHIRESSSVRNLCFPPALWFVRQEGGWGPCLPKAVRLACPPPQACGVDYEVKAFCAENLEEKIHKRCVGCWWERGGREQGEVQRGVMRRGVLREGSGRLSGRGELPRGGGLMGLSRLLS